MDDAALPQSVPHLPRYHRAEDRAVPVSIQPRDLVLLKAIYDFPYCTAVELSRLIPAGLMNPQLSAYHNHRRLERASMMPENVPPAIVTNGVSL